MEAQARKRLSKEVKKVLQTADPMLEGASPILMASPKESAMLESHEEFYDAIMADDPDEEEDEHDENGLVNNHQVWLLLFVHLYCDESKNLNAVKFCGSSGTCSFKIVKMQYFATMTA